MKNYIFTGCLERRALKISANEEVYKGILQVFQEEMNKKEFLQRNAKKIGNGKYELYKETSSKI